MGKLVHGRRRGDSSVCVSMLVRHSEDGSNDKHHLDSLITDAHQSAVPPACLRKSSTDLFTFIQPTLSYYFILSSHSPPYSTIQSSVTVQARVMHHSPPFRARAPKVLFSLPPPCPGLSLSGDKGLRRNRASEELPA